METSKLISKIKVSHLPCYLSDDESVPTPLYADSITFHEFKTLNYHSFQLESSKPVTVEPSASLQYADCPSVAKLPETISLGVLDKRTLVNKLGRAIRGYLQAETLNENPVTRKIKCSSLEKVAIDDLSMFYRYKFSARQIKRMCDVNLWVLLEKTREQFRGTNKDSIQTLLEDLSRLIVNFVSSPDTDLHFTKCKYILDRLQELENIIHDRFNVNHLSQNSSSLSLPSLKTVHSAPGTDIPSLKSRLELGNKPSPRSLKNLTAPPTLSMTPRAAQGKLETFSSSVEEKAPYKQVLSLIAQAKYIMAQMGHLLHYDRLANPEIEQLYPKDFKKKWECNTIPSPPGCRRKRGRLESNTFASFSTAVDVNLASIDLDTEKPAPPSFTDVNTVDDLSHGSNLMRFFYGSQTFLEDFEENVVNRRKESLGKYFQWKMKKWVIKYKKEKVEQKYQESEMVCKICARKVKIDKLKEHSGYCRKMAELDKELKDMEMKLGDAIADTGMRSKELRTQLLVMKNEYQRLKKKNSTSTIQNALGLRQRNVSNGSVNSIDDSNISLIHTQGPNTTRDAHEDLWDEKELRDVQPEESQPDSSRRSRKHLSEMKIRIHLPATCHDDSFADPLNESFTQKDDKEDDEKAYKSPLKDASYKFGERKSFVEKILDKYPRGYEGSPSADRYHSPGSSNRSIKRFHSLTEKKKFNDLLTKSKSSIASQFYSESNSGEDSERNGTDEERIRFVLKMNHDSQYSSESGEHLKLGAEMSSSEKSVCNSPDVSNSASKNKLHSYKKSKFFLGNGLTIEKEDEEQKGTDTDEKKPEQNEEQNDEPEDELAEERFGALLEVKRKANQKRSAVFVPREETRGEAISGKLDRRMLKELVDLKAKIEDKKNANDLYEVIKVKGKIMLNQEAYQKSMEMIKDDAVKEIAAIKAKLTDNDIVAFADNFLTALEKRINVGKTLQETRKLLDALEGKVVEETLDMKANQRKFSLLRGHSSLTLTKKRLGFASTPNIPPSTVSEEQPFSLMRANPIKLKARSSHNAQKSFNDFPVAREQSRQGSFDLNINEKLKKFAEGSLLELQEEAEELPSVGRAGDVSPFGVTNFDSLNQLEKNEKKEKRQNSGIAPFSLDELIANSPRDPTLKSDQIDSKVTQISLVTDDSSPNTGTLTTLKEPGSVFSTKDLNSNKELNSKNLTRTLNEEIEEKSEERKSPETPSFEAPPLIWRTSTAPARTLAMKKLPLSRNDLLEATRNTSQVESTHSGDVEEHMSFSSTLAQESQFENRLSRNKLMPENNVPAYQEEEQESDESKTPPSNLRSRRLLKRLKTKEDMGETQFYRQFTAADESFEDEISPGRQLNRVLHGTGSKRFVEDSMDDVDNAKNIEESPLLMESPLIRGYYSDSHAKKAHRTLTKQSLIGINDFELITLISKGAYGRVWLVRRKATNDIYAMKEINLAEKFHKNTKELENLRKENRIFGLAKEDFVVRALFTFTHETYICFVMEYMLGGDFGDILYNYCALEEEVARFYIAEIVLALEYLHSLGIVHRDLKPDNILLDKRGHAKLTDFGLSETGLSRKMAATGPYNEGSPSMYQKKEQAINELYRNKNELDNYINLRVKGKVMERRTTMLEENKDHERTEEKEQKVKKPHRLIGTPDYMAPEIILGHSFTDYSIDWFSLGVMIFEFLCGIPPFNDETPDKIYDNIIRLKVPWDQIQIGYEENCMSPEAADLVKKLLVLDPRERLGANGADEIKKHPFFKGINWEKLRTQQAPIVPEQKNEIDTSNFVRLADELKNKGHENPFTVASKDKNALSNRQVAKEWIEVASANFSIFNYAALDSDNVRVAEEALKQKEKELKEFAAHELERVGRKGIYDDIFDMPN